MKVGLSPYGSVSQDRMLAIRIGISSGYVSSLVSHTSSSTSMLSVKDRTSGCGHVRMCTRCSSGASHLGQLSCIHCLWQHITMPVAVSTWRWFFEIGKMLVYGLWQYWIKQLTHAEYSHQFPICVRDTRPYHYDAVIDFWNEETTRVFCITSWLIPIIGTARGLSGR